MTKETYLFCYTCKKKIGEVIDLETKWLDNGEHADGTFTGHQVVVFEKGKGMAG